MISIMGIVVLVVSFSRIEVQNLERSECLGVTLVVDLEQADPSSVHPLDAVAGSTSWDTGPTDA